MKTQFSQKGISLYISLMVMSILLSISLGISSIFLIQLETIKGMGNSVVAFYAADTGIEEVLSGGRSTPLSIPETSLNGASYQVIVVQTGIGDCVAANFCIKSIGEYQDVRRAIEIQY